MVLIARLVTFVDFDGANGSQLSFSARQDAVLVDGRRVVLLDDRGWSQGWSQSRLSLRSEDGLPTQTAASSPWEGVTREHIEEMARTVVGPDSAYGNYTQAEMDEWHWSYLSAALAEHGVVVDGTGLRALPHDVELSDCLLAHFADPPS